MNRSLGQQLQAFGARQLGQEGARDGGGASDQRLPEYPAVPPSNPRRRTLVLVGAAVVVVLAVVGLVALTLRPHDDRSPHVVARPPASIDPAFVIATRSAAAEAEQITGEAPARAFAVATTVGAVGNQLGLDQACAADRAVLIVQFEWDEPVGWPGGAGPAGRPELSPTTSLQYYSVGVQGSESVPPCEGTQGTFGWRDGPNSDSFVLAEMGEPAEIDVSDRYLVAASSRSMERVRQLRQLPTSAEAVVATRDQLGLLGLETTLPSTCATELLVIQLLYSPSAQMFGAPGRPIVSVLEVEPLPWGTPDSACTGGAMYSGNGAADLSVVGTPIPLDINH